MAAVRARAADIATSAPGPTGAAPRRLEAVIDLRTDAGAALVGGQGHDSASVVRFAPATADVICCLPLTAAANVLCTRGPAAVARRERVRAALSLAAESR